MWVLSWPWAPSRCFCLFSGCCLLPSRNRPKSFPYHRSGFPILSMLKTIPRPGMFRECTRPTAGIFRNHLPRHQLHHLYHQYAHHRDLQLRRGHAIILSRGLCLCPSPFPGPGTAFSSLPGHDDGTGPSDHDPDIYPFQDLGLVRYFLSPDRAGLSWAEEPSIFFSCDSFL